MSRKPGTVKPIVQISLDLTNIEEALEPAAMALRAGVDWLEIGVTIFSPPFSGNRCHRKIG